MRTAYSYIRFSTLEQKKGNSLTRQAGQWRDEFIAKKGWRLDQSLTFQDLGKSAFKKGKQTALESFLAAIQTGRVKPGSVLVLEQLDGLSRQGVLDALNLLQAIISQGVDVATWSPEKIYSKGDLD